MAGGRVGPGPRAANRVQVGHLPHGALRPAAVPRGGAPLPDGEPHRFVLPVVRAAAQHERRLGPDDLAPDLELRLPEARHHHVGKQCRVPHVGDVAGEKRIGRRPVGLGVIGDPPHGGALPGIGRVPKRRLIVHPVGGIGHHQARGGPGEEPGDVRRRRRVPAREAVGRSSWRSVASNWNGGRARLGQRRRHAITPADVRAALADLRRTRAASTCNHYRQALFSLYRALDGRAATNPVRDVEPFASPAPEARGLSYDAIRRILAAMSDQGSAIVKGRPRAGGSAAKVRCRVLAFTGLRPSELMRYRPEHWDRATQTLIVYTGKGGRTRTIPLSAPAAEALADLEALGAIGPFSMSTVRRAFIRATARIGMHGVRPYDLRHSYGTALYRAGGGHAAGQGGARPLRHADDGTLYAGACARGDARGDGALRGAPRGSTSRTRRADATSVCASVRSS